MLYTLVFTKLIVTLYLAQAIKLVFRTRLAVLFILVFTYLIVTLYLAQGIKLVFRPDLQCFITLVITNLIVTLSSSTSTKHVFRTDWQCFHTLVFRYLIVTLYLARQSSLYLGGFAVLYTHSVYKHNCNLASSTSIEAWYLGRFSVLFILVFTYLIVTLVFGTGNQASI